MSSNKLFRINIPTVSHETIDGETVIINLDSGIYYSMDGVGAEIWSFIESGSSISDIVELIENRYDGDRVDIENSIKKLISDMQKEGLIVPNIEDDPASSEVKNAQVEYGQGEEKSIFKAPILNKYSDMQDLLLLDPIHEVDETGWPTPKSSVEEEE